MRDELGNGVAVATMMQKAVLPAQLNFYLTGGFDQVSGFVVPAAAVAAATTPADLFQVHGLSFPGSPVGPDATSLHVLRFPATAQLNFEDAIGGVDAAGAARTGGPFIDRPPFTGTGFAQWAGGIVPLYWLVTSRVPAGSQLVRVDADATSTLVAQYVDVATGWVAGPGQAPLPPVRVPANPAPYIGLVARFRGLLYAADLLVDTGRVVLSAPDQPAGEPRFAQTQIGRWRAEVGIDEVTELFEISMTGWIDGLHLRVIDNARHDDRRAYWATYIGHNADIAEGLGLQKIDAGVYTAMVPVERLERVQSVQLAASTWPGAGT